MVACFICQKEFQNNSGGQLTLHVRDSHGVSQEEYVILSEYGGNPPICACGFCNERPVFKRGKFLTYAKFHQRFDEREKKWREMYGTPKCERCGADVSFTRGNPQRFCSRSCHSRSENTGFGNPSTQMKIRKAILSKYGVANVSFLPEVKLKISNSLKGKKRFHTEKSRLLIRQSAIERWSDSDFRYKVSSKIRVSIKSNSNEIIRRKQAMKDNHANPVFIEKMWKGNKNRLSKLHLRIREELELEKYGFASEQRVGKFWADELHPELKIIVEIYGDHPHANPLRYAENDTIRLRGQSYFAKDKWAADLQRTKILEKLGYRVMILWESDNIDNFKKELEQLIQLSKNQQSHFVQQ